MRKKQKQLLEQVARLGGIDKFVMDGMWTQNDFFPHPKHNVTRSDLRVLHDDDGEKNWCCVRVGG